MKIISIVLVLTISIYSSALDEKSIVNSSNRFAVNTFNQLAQKEGNVFVSPFSIYGGLFMTFVGSSGNTQKQMSQVLGIKNEDIKTLSSLNTRIASSKKNRLLIANALWGQKGFSFEKKFLDDISRLFGGGLNIVDFIHDKTKSLNTINGWVAQKTANQIKDLLKAEDIDDMTRLVLTNAIYFDGKWKVPFSKKATKEHDFIITKTKRIKAPMMHKSANYNYYEDEVYQAVEIPYVDDEYSMLVILPRNNSSTKMSGIDIKLEIINKISSEMTSRHIELYLPKFSIKNRYNLNRTLINMGMPDAFSDIADFSNMTGKKDLRISKVIHEAYIKTDEEGTQASAATAVVMASKALLRYPVFKPDHPFIFIIKESSTGEFIFIGRVSDPKI